MAPTDSGESEEKTNEVEVSMTIDIEVKRPRLKSVVCVPLDGFSQSIKDRMLNHRNVRRPPKNIDLFEDLIEDVDLETEATKVKRFPSERKLSSKIKKANSGIDYSNHAIEKHYNYNERVVPRKVTSKVQIKKKASLNGFGLAHIANKKKKASKSDAEDQKKVEKAVPERASSERNHSSPINVAEFYTESKSEKLADDEDQRQSIDVTPRQHSIRQGLDEEKFEFIPKIVGPPKPEVTTNFPSRYYRLVNY